MSALTYYLAKHPDVQHRLQVELDAHVPAQLSQEETEEQDGLVLPPADVVVDYEHVKSLPYLNACIKEALRLHSAFGLGLPRIVPPGKTFTFGGETFKAGSVVSVPSFTTNRASVWGTDAEEFRPERWLEDTSASLNKYYVPFSTGSRLVSNVFGHICWGIVTESCVFRSCIGRNLATLDLLLITATVFRRYEVKLDDPMAKVWGG